MDNCQTRTVWMELKKHGVCVVVGYALLGSHPYYKTIYMAIYSMHMPFFFID